jgi:membrane protein required for colicin V production
MMTWIDYGIISIIILSAVIGLFRGFVNEVLSLIVWAAAVYIAFRFAVPVSYLFDGMTNKPMVSFIVSFALLLIITLILGNIIRRLLNQLIEKTGLSGTNRTLGFAFGLCRGVIVLALLLVIMSWTTFSNSLEWKNSVLLPHFKPLMGWMQTWLPSGATQQALTSSLIHKGDKK